MKYLRIFSVLIFASTLLWSQVTTGDSLKVEQTAASDPLRILVVTSILQDVYFAPYFFMLGTSFGGNKIASGDDPRSATTAWAAVALGGMALSWFSNLGNIDEYTRAMKVHRGSARDDRRRLYRMFFGGISSASILDYEAASKRRDTYGGPQWTAGTAEVKTTGSLQ